MRLMHRDGVAFSYVLAETMNNSFRTGISENVLRSAKQGIQIAQALLELQRGCYFKEGF